MLYSNSLHLHSVLHLSPLLPPVLQGELARSYSSARAMVSLLKVDRAPAASSTLALTVDTAAVTACIKDAVSLIVDPAGAAKQDWLKDHHSYVAAVRVAVAVVDLGSANDFGLCLWM